jgi:serine/threonine protein kinase
VRLVDFGIVEPYQAGREQALIGRVGYASPEQYFGYSDERSDVYGLGATLHYLLTRRDPYKEEPFTFHDAPPRSLNPAISEALEAVILKATEHNPEDRYQSAEEMKAALLACL